MWKAKHTNMDTGCGFDWQFMVEAGVDDTLKYLKDNDYKEIAEYLESMRRAKDFDDLPGWEQFEIKYSYRDGAESPSR
jgi:hypothetical protein